MSQFAVTHIDAKRVRRRLLIGAPTRNMALDFAERLYGLAWYMGAVRVKGTAQ